MTAITAVSAVYGFPDGTYLNVTVQVRDSYPDALNQARNEAVRGIQALLDDLEDAEEGDA